MDIATEKPKKKTEEEIKKEEIKKENKEICEASDLAKSLSEKLISIGTKKITKIASDFWNDKIVHIKTRNKK